MHTSVARAMLTGNFLLMAVLSVARAAQWFLKDKEKGMRVGYGMISRREIALVIASMGMTYGIFGDEVK